MTRTNFRYYFYLTYFYFYRIHVTATQTRRDWPSKGHLSVLAGISSATIYCGNNRRNPLVNLNRSIAVNEESGDFRLDVITNGLINFATGARYGNYEK